MGSALMQSVYVDPDARYEHICAKANPAPKMYMTFAIKAAENPLFAFVFHQCEKAPKFYCSTVHALDQRKILPG